MKHDRLKHILLLVIILAGFFALRLPRQDYWGTDALFHYTVVEHNYRQGKLMSYNPLELCYEGLAGIHPLGFYVLPYALSPLLGVKTAFYITPLFFGLLCLLFAFLLFKELFGQKTAVISILLLSLSYAFLTKTFAGSYRGDTFMLPFLLSSLWLGALFLKEKNPKKQAVFAGLSGLISGLSAYVWNGYPLAIYIVLLSYSIYIMVQYLKKRDVRQIANAGVLAGIVQWAGIGIARLLTPFYGKGLSFYENTYFWFALMPFICLMAFFYLSSPYKHRLKMMALPMVLFLALLFLKQDMVQVLLSGFGSITRTGVQVSELTVSFMNYWNAYWVFLLIAFMGVFSYIRRIKNPKYLYFLGFVLPIAYVALSARRFLFLTSFIIVLLMALFIIDVWDRKANKVFVAFYYFLVAYLAVYFAFASNFYMVMMAVLLALMIFTFWRARRFHAFIPFGILLLSMGLHSAYFAESNDSFTTSSALIQAQLWIRENTPENSCFLTTQFNIQETMHYGKRHTYLPSLGGLDSQRYVDLMRYYLSNNSLSAKNEDVYVIATIRDLAALPTALSIAGAEKGTVSFLMPTTIVIDDEFSGMEFLDREENRTFQLREYKEDNITYYHAFKLIGENAYPLRRAIMEDRDYIDPEGMPGCLLGSNGIAFLDEVFCDSNLVRMIAGQPMQGMEMVYSRHGVNIYRVKVN